jgi:glycolate oxidase
MSDSPSSSSRDKALVQLHRALGSKMITQAELVAEYRSDDSGVMGSIDAVVLAESVDDIQTTLRIAHETGVPVTPRAGGSGRTGGAVPISGGIVLATHLLRSIVEIDREEGIAVVQPGVILDELHAAVESEGLFYPPDPNSSAVCCLAGNVAENAAGPRAFKYGATRDYVLGIETIVPGGERFFSGRRTKKGVTGYDTTALLVGSEGTLAAFGNITLRLIPRPEQVMTLLALFLNMESASRAVNLIIQSGVTPRCIEFLDRKTLEVMREQGNALDKSANALLLIEVDGNEESCLTQAERVGAECNDAGAFSVVVAQTTSGRAGLWEARKKMSHAVRSRARHKISEDVVVPRRHLAQLIRTVETLGEMHRIDALCYGHAGDGNLHVNFLWNEPDEKLRVDEAVAALFQKTIALGGTLSGEHGIGLLKAPFMPLEQSAPQIALQKRLKEAFDPRGVMNPGKIFTTLGHGSC